MARLHERISDIRKDLQQKLSTGIVREYAIIGVEDLQVKKLLMENDTDMSRRIQDCAWGGFLQMQEYKSRWYGRELVRADQYFPSSQICSRCGYQNRAVKDLNVREWTCPECGAHHDRDENAAPT